MSTAYSSAKQQYIGNGVTTEWGFDFPIKKHSELKVYLKRSGLSQVLLEEGVDYSFVTENTIAFPIKTGEAKLQATDVLALQRESVFESEYNFSNQQRLEPEEVMHADDNLERQIQELKRDVTQAIRIQPTSNINTDEYFIAVESIYENLDNITNVSGISAEIVNCSDNISDITTVSSNIANVNTVGQSISNVNTVANNISDVNTAVLNIEAIKDAPNQANAASQSASDASQSATNAANSATASANSATASATSANNSHIWAEGTDAQVQALGGVHSSKGWAEQSTNANISLTNTPYTTNRILEIPQDIKLELNNGTLTLKAGSKVYVPNGVGVFGVKTAQQDFTMTRNTNAKELVFVRWSGDNITSLDAWTFCYSGSSAPSGETFMAWYDTSNNVVKGTANGGSTWTETLSFPIAAISEDSTKITSIDQVFNGFGYIGSTVFALPGVKVQIPNGRNDDGSCQNRLYTETSVKTFTTNSDWGAGVLHGYMGDLTDYGDSQYDFFPALDSVTKPSEKNLYLDTVTGRYNSWCPVVSFYQDSTGKITSFTHFTVDSVANSNASNFSQTGRSYLSGLGMPSGRYIDLTLGASGSTYTAPANGWFCIGKQAGNNNTYIDMFNSTKSFRKQENIPLSSVYGFCFIPCFKNDVIVVNYNASGTLAYFRFIYAEGENNV